MSEFQDHLRRVRAGEDLSIETMREAIDWLISGRAEPSETGELLLALRAKGETVDEIAGAALAMRLRMVPLRTHWPRLVDTCGTGGVGAEIFNVSTTAAIVAAAVGGALPLTQRFGVAKHGNRSITSKSGSADVLRELGIDVQAPVEAIARCLDEVGIGFCFAPSFHPAMKNVAAVRRELGVGTIFNLLGPLCNPASAGFQLLGVGRPEIRHQLADVLERLGSTRSLVVSGDGGCGEITIAGRTEVIAIGGEGQREWSWEPSDFGFRQARPAGFAELRVAGPQESAQRVRAVLSGESGPARDMVLMNAAAAVWTTGVDSDLQRCVALCATAIDEGQASELLERWRSYCGVPG